MIRIIIWFLFFYTVYRIVKIFRSVSGSLQTSAATRQPVQDETPKSYSEHDVIDAEFVEIKDNSADKK
ncbi:MAG: hypothetical protein LWX56_01520 [Ignavibacteria bacterium]|nr:hypothetical protein [Ignavibacteria bacterium]